MRISSAIIGRDIWPPREGRSSSNESIASGYYLGGPPLDKRGSSSITLCKDVRNFSVARNGFRVAVCGFSGGPPVSSNYDEFLNRIGRQRAQGFLRPILQHQGDR